MYFQPNSGMNKESAARYAANRLTIRRQVSFASIVLKRPDGTPRTCVIDVVLCVNGLPVVTVELKNPLTGQRARDACKQYQTDRDGRDPLFRFKERALVHFAVDPDEAWMTTELKGTETEFLPFNRGDNNGAGNPPVPDNWKTHYLWDEVLQAASLLDILQRFMHLDVTERTVDTQSGKRTVRRERMIFPRYHQLGAVRSLVAHARAHGPGRNYLIQHSAGSGKSNSIAWLAHRLSSLHDAKDAKVFDSVVVITDRLVLDQQLQNTIYQFEHKSGVVEKIEENTQQLAKALAGGVPIVISTIQKFPFISQAIRTLETKGQGVSLSTAGKRFAVIVDEAHSSQSGETVAALKGILNKDGISDAIAAQISDEEDDDFSDEAKAAILRQMMNRARQPNLSFFAFTATPKYKTKAVFDEPGLSGEAPFHLYSMRQAIEEGFILDVLQNYTTYKRFYELVKQIETDPDVPKKAAAKAAAPVVAKPKRKAAKRKSAKKAVKAVGAAKRRRKPAKKAGAKATVRKAAKKRVSKVGAKAKKAVAARLKALRTKAVAMLKRLKAKHAVALKKLKAKHAAEHKKMRAKVRMDLKKAMAALKKAAKPAAKKRKPARKAKAKVATKRKATKRKAAAKPKAAKRKATKRKAAAKPKATKKRVAKKAGKKAAPKKRVARRSKKRAARPQMVVAPVQA